MKSVTIYATTLETLCNRYRDDADGYLRNEFHEKKDKQLLDCRLTTGDSSSHGRISMLKIKNKNNNEIQMTNNLSNTNTFLNVTDATIQSAKDSQTK